MVPGSTTAPRQAVPTRTPAAQLRSSPKSPMHAYSWLPAAPHAVRRACQTGRRTSSSTRATRKTVRELALRPQSLLNAARRALLDKRASLEAANRPVLLWSRHDADIMSLAAPGFCATLLEPIQALVDAACVGQLGIESLASVGLGTLVFTFGVSFFTALQVVTTANVAAHAAQDDAEQASVATVKALWMALGCGCALSLALWGIAPAAIQGLRGEGAVYDQAVAYLQLRALACPGALLLLAATGACRGQRDARTPLAGAGVQYGSNLVLDFVLIFGPLHMGVAGAAAAAACAQYLGLGVVLWQLLAREDVRLQDLGALPSLQDAWPYAEAGALLSTCNLTGTGVTLTATAMATEGGVAVLAAHTILRQAFALCITTFTGFNIAAQSLVATHVGRQDTRSAREALVRTGQLGIALSLPAALLFLALQRPFVSLFTHDAGVADLALGVLPLLILCMPMDALGASAEGGLLAARDVGFVAKRTAAGAGASLLALAGVGFSGAGLAGVWAAGKLINASTLLLDLQHIRSDKALFRRR